MQEQRHQEPALVHAPASVSERTLNPPANVAQHAHVDAYLDAICAQMPAEVPAEAVQDMRREMHGHLQTTLTAFAEAGHMPEEAVLLTLTQFGEPQVVAKHWQHEWQKTLAERYKPSLWPSVRLAICVWAAAAVVMSFQGTLYAKLSGYNSDLAFLLFFAMLAGLPCLSGIIIGLRAQRHPVLCTLLGYLLTTPLMGVGVAAVDLITLHIRSHSLIWERSWEFVLHEAPVWIPISLLSSGVMTIGRRIVGRLRRQVAR